MRQLLDNLPERWRTAVQGALLGDALGVPHEFKPGHELPPSAAIQMVMPEAYQKTYTAIRCGTWSDDGSQLLALLETTGVELQCVVNDEFAGALRDLWTYASGQTAELQCPLMRLLQIEELLARHVKRRARPPAAREVEVLQDPLAGDLLAGPAIGATDVAQVS